jgi:hypothetical protein
MVTVGYFMPERIIEIIITRAIEPHINVKGLVDSKDVRYLLLSQFTVHYLASLTSSTAPATNTISVWHVGLLLIAYFVMEVMDGEAGLMNPNPCW